MFGSQRSSLGGRPSWTRSQGNGTKRGPTAADTAAPMIDAVFQGAPRVQLVFWDGSTIGPAEVRAKSSSTRPRRCDGSCGLRGSSGSRAYIAGDLDVVGPIGEVLRAFQASLAGRSR